MVNSKETLVPLSSIRRILVIAVLISAVTIGFALTPTPVLASGSITLCSDCHGNPPVDNASRDAATGRFPGSHNKHAGGNAGQYGMACTKCHVNNTATNHRTGYIDMASGGLNGDAAAAYSKGSVSFAQSNTINPGNCANTYCHSNGTNLTTPAANTTGNWGSAGPLACNACHGGNAYGQPTYASGSPKANSHTQHLLWNTVVSCYACHSGTVTAASTAISSTTNHVNRAYTLSPAAPVSFTYSAGNCSANTCHAGRTPRWGTTGYDNGAQTISGEWNCISCHSYSFAKTLGGLGTIRKVVGSDGTADYNMSTIGNGLGSRHLYGATSITKWDCIICHKEGSASGNPGHVNWAYHNDSTGKVDLRNVDTIDEGAASGWSIDNRTWTTKGYTDLDNFCMACHDTDGANAIAVNNSNNGLLLDAAANTTTRTGLTSATTNLVPFNTTDVSSGMVNGSTSHANAPRIRLTNVKDQFYAGTGAGADGTAGWGPNYNGNPSQHAVIGRRYSTINTSWSSNMAWSSYWLKKMNVNLRTTKETSLLSCADCHILDAGNGAHGGVFKYNTWGSTGNNTTNLRMLCWKCHANTTYSNVSGGGARMNHSQMDSNRTVAGNSSEFGMTGNGCYICHGGWSGYTTLNKRNSYGGIHGSPPWSNDNTAVGGVGVQSGGSWNTVAWYSTASTAKKTKYRFMPGTQIKWSPSGGDAGFATTNQGSCYFVSNSGTDGWTACSSHTGAGGSATATYNYSRPVKY